MTFDCHASQICSFETAILVQVAGVAAMQAGVIVFGVAASLLPSPWKCELTCRKPHAQHSVDPDGMWLPRMLAVMLLRNAASDA